MNGFKIDKNVKLTGEKIQRLTDILTQYRQKQGTIMFYVSQGKRYVSAYEISDYLY